MPTISQGLSVPAGLADGQVALASQITPLYNSLNAFIIPATVGVFQQGFVDNNKYTSTGGSTIDWSFTNAANKAVIFLAPFAWSGATAATAIQFTPRINAASATTSTGLTFAFASSGQGLIAGFIGPRSTDIQLGGFYIGTEASTGVVANTLRVAGLSTGGLGTSTADVTSLGFLTSTAGAAVTFTFSGVRFWIEG